MSDYDDPEFEQRCLDAEAKAVGTTFPDGSPIGEWVVICTSCLRCGRNPDHLKCPLCGGDRIPTVDYIKSHHEPDKI